MGRLNKHISDQKEIHFEHKGVGFLHTCAFEDYILCGIGLYEVPEDARVGHGHLDCAVELHHKAVRHVRRDQRTPEPLTHFLHAIGQPGMGPFIILDKKRLILYGQSSDIQYYYQNWSAETVWSSPVPL